MRVEELKLNIDYLNFLNERNPIIELYINETTHISFADNFS